MRCPFLPEVNLNCISKLIFLYAGHILRTMGRMQAHCAVTTQDDAGLAYQMVQPDRARYKNSIKGSGLMKGYKSDIGLASAVFVVPMVAVTVLLIALVHTHLMPNNQSSYSINNGTARTLGSAYFVNYSPTTLVYVSSLSSTLATPLIPAAMILFSYSLAESIAQASDKAEEAHSLPSPFQLQLLMRLIDGKLTVLWSYFLYACGSRQRKIPVVPMLWKALALLLVLILFAYVFAVLRL